MSSASTYHFTLRTDTRAVELHLVLVAQKHLVATVVVDVVLVRQLLQEALGRGGNHDDVTHLQVVARVQVDVVLVVALHDLQNVVIRLTLAIGLVQRHDDRETDIHESVHQVMNILLEVTLLKRTNRLPRTQVHRLLQTHVAHDRLALRGSGSVAGKLQLRGSKEESRT